MELSAQMDNKGIYAMCLQETWRKGQECIDMYGNILVTNGYDLNSKVCNRGQEGVAIMLSKRAAQAWKDAGSEIHCDLGPRIIAIRLSLKGTRNKDSGIFLMSTYSPIGAANQAIWEEYFQNLQI